MSGSVHYIPSDATIVVQVQKIVEFWKDKAESWMSTHYIKNINQLMSIVDGSALTNNPESALDKLFNGRVEYVCEVVLMAGRRDREGKGRMKHKVSCRWPGQTTWIQAEESSAKEAKKVVSLKALEVILGKEFGDFAGISDSLRSLEYNMEVLDATLRSSLEWILERDKILEPLKSGKDLEGYFDDAVLDLDPAIWRKISVQQRESIFKKFWYITSRSKFPQTFNLCGELLPTSSRSVQAFQLLFTPELKWKIRWRKSFTRPFVARLSWQDDCGKDFEAVGEGITSDMAESNAARNALKVVLGTVDFHILNYVAKLFWLRGFDESAVDFKKCLADLKKSVPSVAKQRTSPRSTDVSKDSSVLPSNSCAVALEVSSSRANEHTTTVQTMRNNRNPHRLPETQQVAHDQHMQVGLSVNAPCTRSNQPHSLSLEQSSSSPLLDPQKSLQARHPHGVAVVRPQEATGARQPLLTTPVRQPPQATPVWQPPQASQEMISYSESDGYFCDSVFKKIQESWKSMSKRKKEDILFQFWVDTSRSKFPFIFNLVGEKCVTTSNCYNGFMLLFAEKKSPPRTAVSWETGSDSALHVMRCSWTDEFGIKRTAKGTGITQDSARNAAAREALKVVLGPKGFEILDYVSNPSFLREFDRLEMQRLKRRLLDAQVPLNKQRIRRKHEKPQSQRSDESMNQLPPSGDHSIVPLARAGVVSRNVLGYFNETILAFKPIAWKQMPVKKREEIVYDFWLDTSREKFPCTFNLCGERCCTTTSCLGAFMLLFSEGKTISKPGVKWVNVLDRNPCLVNCYWKDQDGAPMMASGCGSNLDYARNDAARKALQMTLGEVDFKVLDHVSSGFLYEGVNVASIKLRLRANRVPIGDERTKRRHAPVPAMVSIPSPAPGAVARTVPAPAVFATPAANDPRLRPRNLDKGIGATQSAHTFQSQQSASQGLAVAPLRPPHPTAIEPAGGVPPVRGGSNLPGTSFTVPMESRVPLPPQPLPPAGVLFDTASAAVPPTMEDPISEYFSTNDDGSVDIPDWLNDYFKGKHSGVECVSDSSPGTAFQTTSFLPFDEIIGYKFPEEAFDALNILTEGRENDTPIFDSVKHVTADVTVGKMKFIGFGSTEEEARNNAAEKVIRFLEK